VEVVDGSHILIATPHLYAADYYNKKGFHFFLLHGVVTNWCIFWNYVIGQARSMHDANFSSHSAIAQYCKVSISSPYMLIGDATCPLRLWMLYLIEATRMD
jgi:hypothetical protein